MQRKSIIASILYILLGNCSLMGQNNSLHEIKLDEFGADAFVNFDGVMADHNIFLIGDDFEKELNNTNFQNSLIEYLNTKEGINAILLERGISETYFINKYINGESAKYLEMQEEHFREKDIKFFKYLRNYNERKGVYKLQIMGVGIDKYPELEVLYLNEIMAKSSSNNGLKNKIQAAAAKIYSINNFTQILINTLEFSSVDDSYVDYNLLIKNLIQNPAKTYELDAYNTIAFDNFTLNRNTSYSNPVLVAKNNFNYFHSKFPSLKYYAYLPWCNLERERGHRECGVYAFSAFIENKKEFNVYTVLSLQVMPFSTHKRAAQFNSQIKLAAENNYNYSGFGVANDEKVDYVILTKSTVSSSRKELYLEQLGNTSYLSFYINYGLIGYVNNDVEALNASIKNSYSGFSDFKTELGHRFIDLTMDYKGYVAKLSNKWTNEDPVSLNLTESVQFNQSSTTGYLGYNILRHKRNMISPMIGMGYASTRLEYLVTTNTSTPPFTQFKSENYENPGLIMDYMIDVNFATKTFLGLGFNIGYVTDLSSQLWTLNGYKVSNTPKLSNSGFHAGFSALINLNKTLKR